MMKRLIYMKQGDVLSVKRRLFIRAVSFLAAISVALAAAGLSAQKAMASYEETLGKVRMTNLTSLCEFARDISAGLRLLAVSADNSLADSSAYVNARVMGAIGCLNGFDSGNVENISEFLNGANSFAENFSGSESERKAAVMLSDYAQGLYYHLNDITSAVMNGEYSLTEYSSVYGGDKPPYFEDYLDFANGNENEIFKIITPASASAGGYGFFDGKEKISENEARKIASRVAAVNTALWRINKVDTADIEVYSLAYGDIAADICKSGGVLCRLVKPLPCAQSVYSKEDAKNKALEFAEKNGYVGLTAAETQSGEFEASFSMFPEVNGILLLTARVDAAVCLASGEITYFNAAEYIKNYRSNISFNMGNPDLITVLPENLTLKETLNCLVNIDSRDRLCYLAVCRFESDTVLVFVDAYEFKVLKTEIIYAKMQ